MIVKTETFLKLSVFSVHLKYIIGSCNCISTTNISYAYDALGQLIRVNDQTDTTSGATGTTWTYEYDRGGNIISRAAMLLPQVRLALHWKRLSMATGIITGWIR